MNQEHLDVLIAGAGLSGICAAYYLQTRCPTKRYAIFEARSSMGGTWDLFRYPGVRSDSDMFTLGYSFRPWPEVKAIADGAAILRYLKQTAAEYGIDRTIRYEQRIVGANWSSENARWTVDVERGPSRERLQVTCGFLFICSGYYDYEAGYTPSWPGVEDFSGPIVHPQFWPEELDYAGKRVVVIGSGATAVTLVPALAERAAQVTMLQRSPSYIVSLPSVDRFANRMRRRLPGMLAHRIARWRSLMQSMYLFVVARRQPAATRGAILALTRSELGPGFDVERHFTPRYNPWEQRLCLVPDSDLFAAIRSGKASIVTDEIERFSEHGLRLCSGETLEADIIISATGLVMRLLGGAQLLVDGALVEPGKTLSYKGMMMEGVPNAATAFGYTNASWTLKAELIAAYVCRLLNHMDAHGYQQCTPRGDATLTSEDALDFSSGYIRRAIHSLPRQGGRPPWRNHQNYLRDLLAMRFNKLDDGAMEFKAANPQASGR
jgi:cation diffusion facilitator CzcD-associated flavoprotein CzcO